MRSAKIIFLLSFSTVLYFLSLFEAVVRGEETFLIFFEFWLRPEGELTKGRDERGFTSFGAGNSVHRWKFDFCYYNKALVMCH